MCNVLVTGGAGYIGHHLVKRLSARDCKITIIDNLSNANSIFLRKIKSAIQASRVSTYHFVKINDNEINKVSFYEVNVLEAC